MAQSVQHEHHESPHWLLMTAAGETVQQAGPETAYVAAGAGDGSQVEVSPQQETPAPPAVASSTTVASGTAAGTHSTPTSSQTGCQTSLPCLSKSHSPSEPQRYISFSTPLPSRVLGQLVAPGHAALGPGWTTSGSLAASSSEEAAAAASTIMRMHGSRQSTSAGTTQPATHQNQEETAGGLGRLGSQRKAGGLKAQALDRGDSAAEHHMRWAERRWQGGVGLHTWGMGAGSGHDKGQPHMKAISEVRVGTLCDSCSQQHMESIREVRVGTLCDGCSMCVGAACCGEYMWGDHSGEEQQHTMSVSGVSGGMAALIVWGPCAAVWA